MKTLKLRILARHMKGAKYFDNYDCPIARAFKERGCTNVGVGGTFVSGQDKLDRHFMYSIPFGSFNEETIKIGKPVTITLTRLVP